MEKKRFGPQIFLFPLPTVIVGALVDGRPNFNAIAYCGVAQSVPPMLSISMDKTRYTLVGILENRCFSVNVPSRDQLAQVDFVGTVSGRHEDKSTLFSLFYGALEKAPMIDECPVTLECALVDVMDFGGKNDLLIGRIVGTFADEECLTRAPAGTPFPDMSRVEPIAFSRPDQGYWSLGASLGKSGEVGRG
jgi:flavin reductase (DIM6/NTAB) family NADH-FMN oxidoreductase RutF